MVKNVKLMYSTTFQNSQYPSPANALFVWLISHQPTVLFSQNKPAITNQPAVLFSQNKPAPAISHQPNEQAEVHALITHWSLPIMMCTFKVCIK
jgi:hypothetical protein